MTYLLQKLDNLVLKNYTCQSEVNTWSYGPGPGSIGKKSVEDQSPFHYGKRAVHLPLQLELLKRINQNITISDKVTFEIEFVIQASPQLLYQYISTPAGLSEWYADNVNSRGEVFTFIWDESEEKAKMLKRKSEEFVKFSWMEQEEGIFSEMRIIVDEIT